MYSQMAAKCVTGVQVLQETSDEGSAKLEEDVTFVAYSDARGVGMTPGS